MSDGAAILIVLGAIYLLPSLIALLRGKANGAGGVIFLNLLLGWTLVGWVVSFMWACSGTTEADKRRDEQRHQELLAAAAKPTLRLVSPEESTPIPAKTGGASWLVGVTLIILALITVLVTHAQAQTQTRCYQAGPTQVCETKDRTSGAVTSTSRCYQTGSGQTCDTQSFSGSSSSSGIGTIPVPNLNPPRR